MEMNKIPTPETDATESSIPAEVSDITAYQAMCDFSRDLERRLTTAREALEIARVGMSSVEVPDAAERDVLNDAFDHVCDALVLTAPKP